MGRKVSDIFEFYDPKGLEWVLVKIDVENFSVVQLAHDLAMSIEKEDYEYSCILRDELKKRGVDIDTLLR